MPTKPRVLILAALAAFVLVPASAWADGPGTLLGGWHLEQQFYEDGHHNFHDGDDQLLVEFRAEGGGLSGTLSWAAHHSSWPAYPSPTGPAAIDTVSTRFAPDLRSASASFRVLPAPGDDTYLLVEESWQLDEDDRLLCEVRIRFERQGTLRGGFRWSRVFLRGTSQ